MEVPKKAKKKGGSEAAPSSTSWCFRCPARLCQAKSNLAQPSQTEPKSTKSNLTNPCLVVNILTLGTTTQSH